MEQNEKEDKPREEDCDMMTETKANTININIKMK
jgi:hypothetical protein